MGFISVDQKDNLFWLGRYVERVYLTLRHFDELGDWLLDIDSTAYQGYCRRLNIPDIYTDALDFIERYMYDQSNPDSVYSNLSRAYDDGIVLRSVISSASLSYVQMGLDAIDEGRKTHASLLLSQQIIDCLLAFWGCIDDYCDAHQHRNVIKAGRYMERLDMQLRLHDPWPRIEVSLRKLQRRIAGGGLKCDGQAADGIMEYVLKAPEDDDSYLAALKLSHGIIIAD